jgi:hypothetical protein
MIGIIEYTVAKHVVMRVNVEAPAKLKNLRPTQIDWQLVGPIDLY